MSYYYDNYYNYEEINNSNAYDDSGCASKSDDVEWDHPPSELDDHYYNHKLTPFNLDHYNQEPTPSGHYHDNLTCSEMDYKLTYRGNKFGYQ